MAVGAEHLVHRQIGGDPHLDAMPREDVAGALQGGADDLGNVHQVQPQLDRAGFEAGHVEQVADEAVEALGLLLKRGEELVALG